MPRWPARTLAERFWEKVHVGPADECWPWLAYRDDDGYGIFRVATSESMRYAHQVAWELATGKEWPKGQESRHGCDNRGCCNPSHIEPGSHTENVRDSWRRGRRSNAGAKNPRARFSETEVLIVRTLASVGVKRTEIARAYGVHVSTVGRIVRGATWASL